MSRRLDGKVVVVTGAGSGIGESTAQLFHAEGAQVVAADVSGKQHAVVERLGDGAVATDTDVSDSAAVQAMIDTAVDTFGGLDGVVNCAGIPGEIAYLLDSSDENCDEVLGVNLRGTFLVCKYAVKAMVESGGGSIVTVASAGGLRAEPTLGIYGATKAGVVMLSKSTAAEYAGQGVRVNSICPGTIDTPMLRGAPPEVTEMIAAQAPLGRLGTAAEIADAALFLVSDESSYVTGTVLSVDGGMTA